MNIIRRPNQPMSSYRPATLDDQFSRMVESMFDDFFAPFTGAGGVGRMSGEGITSPRLNVVETDKTFEIEAELPGVKKEDVKVAIDRQRVTIEAEAKRERAENEGENVVYAERSSRKYMRSFTLASDVDDANAQARLEDGVLTLTLPKRQDTQAKRLTVQ